LTSTLQRAVQLGEFALFYDNPQHGQHARADNYQKVTAADVQRCREEVPPKENPIGGHHDAAKPGTARRREAAVKRYLVGVLLAGALVGVRLRNSPRHPIRAKPKGPSSRTRRPVNKEILKVTLPKAQEADLSNGVHLIVIETIARRRSSSR
jgi:hypothetical protein